MRTMLWWAKMEICQPLFALRVHNTLFGRQQSDTRIGPTHRRNQRRLFHELNQGRAQPRTSFQRGHRTRPPVRPRSYHLWLARVATTGWPGLESTWQTERQTHTAPERPIALARLTVQVAGGIAPAQMDDLEVNPLYKAFLGRFRREFEIACRMSYMLAIPHSDQLEGCVIDQHFANSHILMPSKLLKM